MEWRGGWTVRTSLENIRTSQRIRVDKKTFGKLFVWLHNSWRSSQQNISPSFRTTDQNNDNFCRHLAPSDVHQLLMLIQSDMRWCVHGGLTWSHGRKWVLHCLTVHHSHHRRHLYTPWNFGSKKGRREREKLKISEEKLGLIKNYREGWREKKIIKGWKEWDEERRWEWKESLTRLLQHVWLHQGVEENSFS